MAVGVSIPRVDGVEKVTGAAKFTGDISFSDLLEARVLRSPLPHAAIEAIDTGIARALPGVIAVLTRKDLKDIDPYYGNCLRDRAVVAIDRARFVGEPIAVVAAENALIAEEALTLIDVRYKELPCVPDIEAARAEGAPVIHENLAGAGEFHDVAGVGERPLGVQASQIRAVARWLRDQQQAGPVYVAALGRRTGLGAQVAAALEPEAIAGVHVDKPFATLKQIIDENLQVTDGPELFCFGLLQEFDIPEITALAQQ